MNLLQRGLVGVGVAGVGVALVHTGSHYDVDRNAAEHRAQTCAANLNIDRLSTLALQQSCSGFNIIMPDTAVTDRTVTITDAGTFLKNELPMATIIDESDQHRRDREALGGYAIALLAGTAVAITINSNAKKQRNGANVPVGRRAAAN